MKTAHPEDGDIQAAKRDMLRLARENGQIHEHEIAALVPLHHLSPSELEVLYFTLEMMEIDVVMKDGDLRKNAGKLELSVQQ